MRMGHRPRMATAKALALMLSFACATCLAQSTGKTVRHHTVPTVETAQSPDLAQAESFLEKKDLPAAEALLHKVIAAEPANYVAWFDLGFAQSGLGKTSDSIASYRKSVDLEPDVFESNLNLG